MSAIDGGWDAGFRDEDYRFESYQPDLTPKEHISPPAISDLEDIVRTRSLVERVQIVKEGSTQSTYLIDGILTVKSVSDMFRNHVIGHWSDRRSASQIKAWSALVITAFSVAAIVGGLSYYIGIATTVCALFSIYEFYQAHHALHQINGWKVRPANAVALQRKEAYEKGFIFAFNHNLKLDKQSNQAVLLPFEVLHLFERYAIVFSQKLSMQNCSDIKHKKGWLDSFLDNNPISKEMLVFAFGKIPVRYEPINQNFELLRDALTGIKKDFDLAHLQAKADCQNALSEIESKRSLIKMPIDRILRTKLEQARQSRNAKLQQEGVNLALVEEDYKIEVAEAQTVYDAAVFTINVYFDGKVSDAKEKLSVVLKQIDAEQAEAYSPYYSSAKQLIIAALNAVQDPSYVYKGNTFSKEKAIHIPVMPKIEIHFDYTKPGPTDSAEEYLAAAMA